MLKLQRQKIEYFLNKNNIEPSSPVLVAWDAGPVQASGSTRVQWATRRPKVVLPRDKLSSTVKRALNLLESFVGRP